MTIARANWRALCGSTAARAGPSRRCRCQSSGRAMRIDSGIGGLSHPPASLQVRSVLQDLREEVLGPRRARVGIAEEVVAGAILDDLARVHEDDAVAHLAGEA